MIVRPAGQETALDRVAGALSSEAARTELYRYATNIAEALPPDSTTWYVVGAVMQVNAVTRRELTTLAKEAKKGGTILAGFLEVAQHFPKITAWTTFGGLIALLAGSVLVGLGGWGGYAYGCNSSQFGVYSSQEQVRCDTLQALRHDLVLGRQQPAIGIAERRLVAASCPVATQRALNDALRGGARCSSRSPARRDPTATAPGQNRA